jgi:hypothetical protein
MVRGFSALVLLAVFGCSSEALNSAGAGGESSGGASTGTSGSSAAGGQAPSTGLPALSRAPYPSGPYGHGVGATMPNLSFLGWRDPVAAQYDSEQLEVLSLSDFYNPNGTPDRPRIIALNASAVWCTVCRAEYRQLQSSGTYATYHPKGVEMLGVLFQDNNYGPAQPADLTRWGTGFEVAFPLALDPGFKTGQFFASDATPLNLLIDASNMQILKVTMGYDVTSPEQYWGAIDKWLSK